LPVAGLFAVFFAVLLGAMIRETRRLLDVCQIQRDDEELLHQGGDQKYVLMAAVLSSTERSRKNKSVLDRPEIRG